MTGAVDYARQTITVPAGSDLATVWQHLGRVPGLVAVNIVDDAGQSALLTSDMLAHRLRAGATTFVVDALPAPHYTKLTTGKIDLAIAECASLRGAWRTRPIGDTAVELQTLLRRLTEIALLVSILGNQRGDTAMVSAADRLLALASQLAASSFQFDDTVRASDDVHYEIGPLLKDLLTRFEM